MYNGLHPIGQLENTNYLGEVGVNLGYNDYLNVFVGVGPVIR